MRTSLPLRGSRAWVVALCLLFTHAAIADSHPEAMAIPSVSPAREGFSGERLQRINDRMEEAVADGIMVGGQGAIARNGVVIFNETWGMADREAGRPMTDDALYRIYSMSKPITAVAVMMLYEQGHFLLEDPVSLYLPSLAGLTVAQENDDGELVSKAPYRQPTIRDLLRHTAGMSYGIFGNTAVDKLYRESNLLRAPTLTEFIDRLGNLPLLFQPGSRWHYSVAVDVQGALVEAVSGQPFGDFLREHLFTPLGMYDTFFVIPEEKRSRLAQLYTPKGTVMDWNSPWQFSAETELVPADPELTQGYLDGSLFESGGGGLISSTDDYLRFALMLANGGSLNGVQILSPKTIEHMRKNHLGTADSSGLWGMDGFGLGVGVIESTAGKSGELGADSAYGWGGAAGTNFWVDPVDNVVGVFMVQSVPHQTPLAKRFRVLTYQALVE
ncbi:serine hydrolase domain-containing protein [Congregibacter litoralis]|uniref:Beta-lactamase class C and other penicillin binding protein n=1 Tax=Congregibacter litoralis KT71 TaxID=314285 RepID=A4A3E5_9GAMM|nr:serine hydrolase domain-containing protein [Congregibacter litoralis]EAQ99218.1 Beta-lactamase class C and other penicillin binding protein [Congregibacter litoralis KT71]